MKKKIYELLRNYVARRATGNLGKVEILEDQIVCYVDGRKLKKKEKYMHRYNLIFKCIPSKEEIFKTYNLEKPVHYIIEDVDFDREVNIMASMKNCHVTFENCTFTGAVGIDFGDHITFINNIYEAQNYKNIYSIYKEGEFCISTRTKKSEINKIEFINDDIDVEPPELHPIFKSKSKKRFAAEIYLYAKEITMTKTDIINAKSIEVGTDNLILNKVNISSEEIEVDANKIESHYFNSEIKSDIISVKTNSYFGELEANYKTLFVNGIEINKNELNINEETLKLQKQRLELLSTLKKIERNAQEQISQELKQQPLTKVLKK